jgi:hypothetical protein
MWHGQWSAYRIAILDVGAAFRHVRSPALIDLGNSRPETTGITWRQVMDYNLKEVSNLVHVGAAAP